VDYFSPKCLPGPSRGQTVPNGLVHNGFSGYLQTVSALTRCQTGP